MVGEQVTGFIFNVGKILLFRKDLQKESVKSKGKGLRQPSLLFNSEAFNVAELL